ncbi:MAG: hypothetical protein U1E77_06685 [Inhella sp.]
MKLWPALLLLTALPQAAGRLLAAHPGAGGAGGAERGRRRRPISGAYPLLLQQLATQGCRFVFQPVPRAPPERLFETGAADLIVPATHSERRDAYGEFVPLILSRPAAVSLQSRRAPQLHSTAELLARKELRVVVVRGFDFGAPYQRPRSSCVNRAGCSRNRKSAPCCARCRKAMPTWPCSAPPTSTAWRRPAASRSTRNCAWSRWTTCPGARPASTSNKSLSPADRDPPRQMLQEVLPAAAPSGGP